MRSWRGLAALRCRFGGVCHPRSLLTDYYPDDHVC
jgi:hypothetical protein